MQLVTLSLKSRDIKILGAQRKIGSRWGGIHGKRGSWNLSQASRAGSQMIRVEVVSFPLRTGAGLENEGAVEHRIFDKSAPPSSY